MNITKRIQNYLEQHHISQAELARSLGYSPAVINQYLKGSYKGNTETIESKCIQYISGNKKPKERDNIMQTANVSAVSVIINQSVGMRCMGLVSGASGSGKTTAIKHVLSTLPQSILIEVTPTTTTKSLFIAIAERLKLNTAYRNLNQLKDDINDALTKRDALIVIDEAEYLTKNALESVRRIWDITKTPVVYCGTDKIMQTLGSCPQLRNRITLSWVMEKLSQEDTVSHCQKHGISNAVASDIHRHANGNYRDVANMIATGLMLAGAKSYDEGILEAVKGVVFI